MPVTSVEFHAVINWLVLLIDNLTACESTCALHSAIKSCSRIDYQCCAHGEISCVFQKTNWIEIKTLQRKVTTLPFISKINSIFSWKYYVL